MHYPLCLSLALTSPSAEGHAFGEGVNDLYAGFLHPVTALEHVLPILALGLLIAQQGTHKAQGALMVFWIALIGGASAARVLPTPSGILIMNLLSVALFGLLVATARALPLPVLYAMAIVFGLSHGLGNGSAMTDGVDFFLFVPGVALAVLLLLIYGLAGGEYALRQEAAWPRIGVRVLGSWIAAVGILVLGQHVAA